MCKNYIVYKSDRKYYNPTVVLEKWLYSDIRSREILENKMRGTFQHIRMMLLFQPKLKYVNQKCLHEQNCPGSTGKLAGIYLKDVKKNHRKKNKFQAPQTESLFFGVFKVQKKTDNVFEGIIDTKKAYMRQIGSNEFL